METRIKQNGWIIYQSERRKKKKGQIMTFRSKVEEEHERAKVGDDGYRNHNKMDADLGTLSSHMVKSWLELPAHWFCNSTDNNTEMWQIPTPDRASPPFTQTLHTVLDHVGSQPHLSPTLFVISNNHPPPTTIAENFFGSGNWNLIYHLLPSYMRVRLSWCR
jgi:hypothetical protein